jgi:hypothetical protein
MKESFEQPQIVPEKNLETMYLEQGVKVQKALNAALEKARDRKIMLGMKDPGKESFFITKEEVQILKDKYDEEFKKLQELGKDIPEDTLVQFSELDTLEEWEDRLEMLQRLSAEKTQKFVIKEPKDPQTEPGWHKLHPDDQMEKMTKYLKQKKEFEEFKD